MLGYEGCGYLLWYHFQSAAFCPLNLKDSYLSHKRNTFIPFRHSRVSTHCSIKSRISSKYHQLKSPKISSSKSGRGETLGVIHLGEKFLSVRLGSSKTSYVFPNYSGGHAKYDRHGRSQIQKGGDTRNKCVTGPRQFRIQQGKFLRLQCLEVIFCGQGPCPLGLWLWLLGPSLSS